ncbi:MAG TPA: SulP family inorganic anion transporter, partial [Polyangiaceae bacterium]|nr:SulP family inorganic anion transporter [Polyangiaceae bacterium]
LDQLKNLTGVPSQGGVHDGFISKFYQTWVPFPTIHADTLKIGLVTIAFVLGVRWLKKRLNLSLLPDLLLAVIASGIWVASAGLDEAGVKVIGKIPNHLPSFAVPDLNWETMRKMSSGALALALLGCLEAISMAKAIAAHTRQRLDVNQQLLSEGVANFMGSCFQCYPGSGSLTRSAINHQAGAVTQWSGVVSAIFVATTMVLFAPMARYVPRAALAGILIITAFKMVEWRSLAYHFKVSRFDAAIILATSISAVAVSIEFCVLIGVLISFVMAVPRVGKVLLTEFVEDGTGYVHERLPSDPRNDRVLVFGLEGELFFAAATSLESQLAHIESAANDSTAVVVLRLKRARNPDAVGLSLIEEFLSDMKERGIVVLLCGVRESLKVVLDKAGTSDRVGNEHIFVEQPVRQTSTHQALLLARELVGERPKDATQFQAVPRWLRNAAVGS